MNFGLRVVNQKREGSQKIETQIVKKRLAKSSLNHSRIADSSGKSFAVFSSIARFHRRPGHDKGASDRFRARYERPILSPAHA